MAFAGAVSRTQLSRTWPTKIRAIDDNQLPRSKRVLPAFCDFLRVTGRRPKTATKTVKIRGPTPKHDSVHIFRFQVRTESQPRWQKMAALPTGPLALPKAVPAKGSFSPIHRGSAPTHRSHSQDQQRNGSRDAHQEADGKSSVHCSDHPENNHPWLQSHAANSGRFQVPFLDYFPVHGQVKERQSLEPLFLRSLMLPESKDRAASNRLCR